MSTNRIISFRTPHTGYYEQPIRQWFSNQLQFIPFLTPLPFLNTTVSAFNVHSQIFTHVKSYIYHLNYVLHVLFTQDLPGHFVNTAWCTLFSTMNPDPLASISRYKASWSNRSCKKNRRNSIINPTPTRITPIHSTTTCTSNHGHSHRPR
jgi:hypothetical protein